MSSSTKTSSDRLVPTFTNHVVGTICQSCTCLLLLPLTQRLMSLRQNQNSFSTSLVERYYFFIPLYVGARCLVYYFRLWHCIQFMYWLALPNIVWQSWVVFMQCATRKQDNQSPTWMSYVPHHDV